MKREEPIDFQCPRCEGDLRSAIAALERQIAMRLKGGNADSMEWYALSKLADALAEVSRRVPALDYVGMPSLVEDVPVSAQGK